MSSLVEKQARLVNAIHKANNLGNLKWHASEAVSDIFYTSVKDNLIYLSMIDENGTESVKVEIFVNGEFVESFIDDDLAASEIKPIGFDYWFQALTSLLDYAKRSASGVDKILDELIKYLDG